MARTIATKLVIEGESEYKRALSRINAEHGTLKAELSAVKAEYAGNANSVKALAAQLEILEKLQQTVSERVQTAKGAFEAAKTAQAQYAQQVGVCKARLEEAQRALSEFQSTGDGAADKERALAEAVAQYSEELEGAEKVNAKAQDAVYRYAKKLESAQKDEERFKKALADTKKYHEEAQKAADGHAVSIDEYGKKTRAAEKQTRQTEEAIQALSNVLMASGLKAGFREVVNAIQECIDASVQFESAMAGVKRTVGGSDEEISAMGKAFQKMSLEMPITAAELAQIATTAGQLGVAREQVEDFTRIMAMLATTTDLTAENAATLLAQFANITGLEDYERLGAVVAELGDATATTATKVVEMSQGFAAAGSQAGMRETEIMAISAAVGSLGIEAQAGSTAMSTLVSSIFKSVETGSDKLEQFAAIAEMDAANFAKAWKNDAAGAFTSFIEGLSKNEKSAVVLLDDLGITNVRQTKAILGLAEAGDLLENTINQANQAWEENAALMDKASIMYETTEAKMTMLSNSFEQVEVAVGDELTPLLGDLAEAGTDAFVWAADVIEQFPWLVDIIMGLVTALAALAAGITAYTVVTTIATPVIHAFNAALKACPAIFVASAIIGVVTAIASLISKLKQAKGEMEDTGEELEEIAEDTTPLVEGLEDVADGAEDATEKIFDLGDTIKETKNAYKLLTEAQEECTETGYLSLDMVEKLINAGLLGYLEEVDGGYQLTTGALKTYLETQRAEYQLAYDEAENAAQKVVNAEALKVFGYDTTTMSIREQLVAMRELYAMKLGEARAAGLEEHGDDAIGRKLVETSTAVKNLVGLVTQADNAIRNLDAAEKNLGSFERVTKTMERDYGTGGKSKKSKETKETDAKEQAVKELEDQLADMEHEIFLLSKGEGNENAIAEKYRKMMDLLHEQAESFRKQGLAEDDDYIQKLQKKWWGYSEERQSLLKASEDADRQTKAEQYQMELDELNYLQDMDLVSTEDYWLKYIELQRTYLEEGSDEWKNASREVYGYLKEQHEEQLEVIETGYDEELKAQTDAYKEQQAAAKERNKAELEDLKEHFQMRQETIKAGYTADKEAAKEAYEEKKALIEEEVAQEQKKLNAKIEAIDAEIAARKRLREDESEDDEIAKAKKRLQAAQAQQSYARTEEDRQQWDLEVIRLQEALSKALQDKEDTAFEREKADEKAAIKEQLTAVKESGDQAKEEAKVAYESALNRLEGNYSASLERVQAEYDSDMAMTEKRYETDIQRLEANYNATVARLQEETKSAAIAWMASNPEAVYQAAATSAGGLNNLDLSVLTGMLGRTVSSAAGILSMTGGSNISNSKNSFAVNNYGGTLSEGHAMNLFMKLLEKMSK